MNQQLYQPVILKHSRNPFNCTKPKHYTNHAEGYNRVCGDHVEVYVDITDGRVTDIGFTAQGCAVTKACASVMTLLVKGKTPAEINGLLKNVRMLWESEGTAETGTFDNPDMNALSHLQDYPSRWKCAALPWETLNAAITGDHKTVTTEP